MQNPLQSRLNEQASPWQILFVLVSLVLCGLLIFNVIGIGISLFFFDFDVERTIDAFTNPMMDDSMKVPLLLLQGIVSLGTFILIPVVVLKWFRLGHLPGLFKVGDGWYNAALLTAMITFCFMVVNSVIIKWNMEMSLPESLGWFERWARMKEDELGELTEYITAFDGSGQFVLAMLVVGILPAVGEELLFRGLFQNLFHRIFSNVHIAIWFTALLFAAFHVQFYGIVPRMMLGVLFGYLYFWSGSLTYPMIAHFVNNGFMLTMVYLKDLGMITYDIEAENATPSFWVITIFGLITIGLLYLFFRQFNITEDGRVAKSL